MKSISFYSFPPLEHGGGAEQYFINTSSMMADIYPNTNFRVVTSGEKVFNILLFLLSVYYMTNVFRDGKFREKRADIKRRMNKAKYYRCNGLKSLKNRLNESDVIYSRNELIDLFFLKLIGYKNLPPVVIGVHTPVLYPETNNSHAKIHNAIYGGFFYKWLMKGVAIIKVANTDDQKMFETHFKMNNVITVHHPLVPPSEVIKTKTSFFEILFLGRLTNQKGIDILVDCIEQLSSKKDFTHMKFSIAGDGDKDLRDSVIRLSDKYKNVNYLGHVKKQNVSELFSPTDIVLIPSRYETVNQVVLEAGINQCIAVASDIPGPRDLIINGVTGYLVEPNVDSFTQAVVRLYDMKAKNYKKFKAMTEAADKHIRTDFSPTKYAGSMWNAFEEVLRKNDQTEQATN